MRRKGKVHPSPSSSGASPSSSSSSDSTTNKDALSVLKLLPAAILTIVSVLSLEDREVLAYMIARSIKSTNPSTSLQHNVNKNSNKLGSSSCTGTITHKPPVFDCECFDCYTSYWFRWDSSPNRELIHQAIEAFEERELPKKGKNKKKDKNGSRRVENIQEIKGGNTTPESCVKQASTETGFSQPESAGDLVTESIENVELLSGEDFLDEDVEEKLFPETTLVLQAGGGSGSGSGSGGSNHKGLARKVLPDVLGLFNSRLWNLWGPNI